MTCTGQSTDRGPMFQFWTSYIDLVHLLLRSARAMKNGDWSLHLQCIQEMLPWMFAYDRINYNRYLSVYWCHMQMLPSTHPDAHSQMVRGELCNLTQPDVQLLASSGQPGTGAVNQLRLQVTRGHHSFTLSPRAVDR